MIRMDLPASECDGRAVVSLRGELDVVEAASVAAALAAVAGREREMIIDLAGLEFIDSSGLAALAFVRAQARRSGGDVVLAAPREQVTRLLTLTRLIDVFPVYASVEQAANSVGRSVLAAVPLQ